MATIYQAKIQINAESIRAIFTKVYPKGTDARKMNNLTGFVNTYNELADFFAIDTSLEVAHFFSQVGHECDQFNAFEEYASGAAYEGRKDLGNLYAGDGVKFKGRGALQTTGRANYRLANAEFLKFPFLTAQERSLFENEGLLRNPAILAEPKWATLSAMIYWTNKDINNLCMPDNQQVTIKRYDGTKWYNYTCFPIEAITRKVNGGMNGFEERKAFYQKIKAMV
jgi:putative chitinase